MNDPDYVAAVNRVGYCQADLACMYPKAYPVEKMKVALHEAWMDEKRKSKARPPTPTPDEPSTEALDSVWNAAAPEPPVFMRWEGKCKSLSGYSRQLSHEKKSV
jgi:hypothetical protein